MPKCQWCNNQGEKLEMYCEEKDTGKVTVKGNPKILRKYYHEKCYNLHLKDKEFKKVESEKLDVLYSHILKIHGILALDGRMMEKLQDLRNGSIKVGNKKITKYKEGVSYDLMLQTYKYLETTIDNILRTMEFERKWNEFSYIFGIVVRNLNDVMEMNKRLEYSKVKEYKKIENTESIDIEVSVKKKKSKDGMDISEFL